MYRLTLSIICIDICIQIRLIIMNYTNLNYNTLNDDFNDLNKDIRLNIYEDS